MRSTSGPLLKLKCVPSRAWLERLERLNALRMNADEPQGMSSLTILLLAAKPVSTGEISCKARTDGHPIWPLALKAIPFDRGAVPRCCACSSTLPASLPACRQLQGPMAPSSLSLQIATAQLALLACIRAHCLSSCASSS
jgi:hypothetical protein